MTKIVHTVSSLSPQSGGTTRVVRDLTYFLSKEENLGEIALLSQHLPCDRIVAEKPDTCVKQRLACSNSSILLKAGWPLKKLLKATIAEKKIDLLHDHGIWTPSNHNVAMVAKRYGIPLLIHPHGMLEPWAMNYRARKKKLALWLYQQRDLEAAQLFFATAYSEVESIRRLGLKQPVAVIPNGIEIPILNHRRSKNHRSTLVDSPRNAVFMSRIHPIKGILNLVEAWGRVRSDHWRLNLAGPDEGGHLAEVMQRVSALGLNTSVEYLGEVVGAKKAALLESADLFILPSFSENFGVVVAEALANGIPVITTKGTPWEELPKHGCGWWVEPTVDGLSFALREAKGIGQADLHAMGNRGIEYIQKFNWPAIAGQTVEVYRWLLGQGSIPAYVVCE